MAALKPGGAGAAFAREERAHTIRAPAASDVTAHGPGETCGRDEENHRRWEGGKWRRRFCGWAAPLSSDRSAKTVTPRGGPRSTPGGSSGGRARWAARPTERSLACWGGPWAKHKIQSERVAASVFRARIADLRSDVDGETRLHQKCAPLVLPRVDAGSRLDHACAFCSTPLQSVRSLTSSA
jgi:hypothetical protein